MVSPKLLVGAINGLIWAFSIMGGAFIAVLLYVWGDYKKTTEHSVEALRDEISKVSHNLEGITKLIFDRQNELAHKVVEMETRCEERNRNGIHDLFRRRDDWRAE